jgi:hypothetical protein
MEPAKAPTSIMTFRDFRDGVAQAAREGATAEKLDTMMQRFVEFQTAALPLALGATRQCQLLVALRASDAGKYPDTLRIRTARWSPLRAAFVGAVAAAGAGALDVGAPRIDPSVAAVNAVLTLCAADIAAGKLAWPEVADPAECPAVAAMVRGREDVVRWLEANGYEWEANRRAVDMGRLECNVVSLAKKIVHAGDRALWAHFLSSKVSVRKAWWYEYGCVLRVVAVDCRSVWATCMMVTILPLSTDGFGVGIPTGVLQDAMSKAVVYHNVDMLALLLDQPCFSRALYKGVLVYEHYLRPVYRRWFLERARRCWRPEEWDNLAYDLEAQGYADAAAKMRDTEARVVV